MLIIRRLDTYGEREGREHKLFPSITDRCVSHDLSKNLTFFSPSNSSFINKRVPSDDDHRSMSSRMLNSVDIARLAIPSRIVSR